MRRSVVLVVVLACNAFTSVYCGAAVHHFTLKAASRRRSMSQHQLALVTSFPRFDTTPKHRRRELVQAFQMNAALSMFSSAMVFEETTADSTGTFAASISLYAASEPWSRVEQKGIRRPPFLQVQNVSYQPTYKDIMLKVQAALGGHVVVVTHADIFFDQTILCAMKLDGNPDVMLTLSRQPSPFCPWGSSGSSSTKGEHIPGNLCEDYLNSHDVFIFQAPAKIDVSALDFHPNDYGAENVFIEAFKLAGYRVFNPCRDIHALHHHCYQGFSAGKDHVNHMILSRRPVDASGLGGTPWTYNVRQPPSRLDCSDM